MVVHGRWGGMQIRVVANDHFFYWGVTMILPSFSMGLASGHSTVRHGKSPIQKHIFKLHCAYIYIYRMIILGDI